MMTRLKMARLRKPSPTDATRAAKRKPSRSMSELLARLDPALKDCASPLDLMGRIEAVQQRRAAYRFLASQLAQFLPRDAVDDTPRLQFQDEDGLIVVSTPVADELHQSLLADANALSAVLGKLSRKW